MFGAVDITQSAGKVDVAIDGKPFTSLHYGDSVMKPFLHPLISASGKTITRGWPIAPAEGESKDHPHHTGLWFTHGIVNGLDFWTNAKAGPQFGRVAVDKIRVAKGGKKSGKVDFEARWLTPENKAILKEVRKMNFSSEGESRIIDFESTLTALDQPLKFGDTKEGFFAIRLSDKLAEKGGTGKMTNAAGATGMKDVWGKPSPWVDYSGTLDGEPIGVAIFDANRNPKHPTTWHARDYGLFAANPFGDHDFYNDKEKDGSMIVAPGKSMHFRYRIVIHPGDVNSAKIADMYKAWKQ